LQTVTISNREVRKVEKTRSGAQLRIGFVLSRQFTLSAFALFVDTLRLAGDELDRSERIRADWHVLGSTRHLIRSSCGVSVAPTSDFLEPSNFDYIVVVGGLLTVDEPVDTETVHYLQKADRQGVPLIGVCTGTFVLAKAGLMGGHQACVSWLHYKAYRERFPESPARSDRLFDYSQGRGSCVGGASSADMAAFLVRRHIDRSAERNALDVLQIDRARSGTDLQSRQPLAEDFEDAVSDIDPRLRATLLMMERDLGTAISIEKLASRNGVSRRQLERMFDRDLGFTPVEAYTRLRMKKAQTLLQNPRVSLIEIALEVGLNSAPHLSRTFKRAYGITPSQYRRRRQVVV
jgi:transcriptional regulator GlxA family with amidase domain